MSNWFKDDQRVLVYHPGAGGEYVTSILNGQKLILLDSNRYKSLNSFPAHDLLYKTSTALKEINQEWSEECRLNFSSEQELKEFINKTDPTDQWKFSSGNPDRDNPRLGRRNVLESSKWFHTHFDFNLFREPVWKWLDYTNPYWILHWALCIIVKGDVDIRTDTLTRTKSTIKRFKKYYSNKFPNSRIDVDDLKFRADTNYLEWAQKNIDAISEVISPDTYGGEFISYQEYEDFLELPK